MKDYYKIMDLPYSASREEIRKAYHRLAKKYHPDKNPGNAQAASVFLDVQEAYDILSDEVRRKAFLLQRDVPFVARQKTRLVTGQTLLAKCRMLHQTIVDAGKYRINYKQIRQSVDAILDRDHIGILLNENNPAITEAVIRKLLQIMNILPYRMLPDSISKLLVLAGNQTQLRNQVLQFSSRKRKNRFWESYNLGIVVLCTVLICLLILLLS